MLMVRQRSGHLQLLARATDRGFSSLQQRRQINTLRPVGRLTLIPGHVRPSTSLATSSRWQIDEGDEATPCLYGLIGHCLLNLPSTLHRQCEYCIVLDVQSLFIHTILKLFLGSTTVLVAEKCHSLAQISVHQKSTSGSTIPRRNA